MGISRPLLVQLSLMVPERSIRSLFDISAGLVSPAARQAMDIDRDGDRNDRRTGCRERTARPAALDGLELSFWRRESRSDFPAWNVDRLEHRDHQGRVSIVDSCRDNLCSDAGGGDGLCSADRELLPSAGIACFFHGG